MSDTMEPVMVMEVLVGIIGAIVLALGGYFDL